MQTNRSLETAWVLSCGTELTLGQTLDTNAAWLAQRLAACGVRVTRFMTVADELADIRDALRQAAAACDLILTTGGLGPTEDDLTRQALAEVSGAPLELDPGSAAQIRAYFARRGRPMSDKNLVQALRPKTARAIQNTCGTAPGIFVELNHTPCYVMPGVPFEMKTMFERDVEPHLQAAARGRTLLSRRLHCFGLGETDLGARIRDLMQRGRNPEVGTTAQLGVIGIRVNAAAATREQAEQLLDETEREIRARLGDIVFGREDDTLASVVGELLAARQQTVCTAESCTGGLLAKFLTDAPGSSRYFLGGVVAYANEAKERLLGLEKTAIQTHGAVSELVAGDMAIQARVKFGGLYALAITGIAGPGGGTVEKPVGLVYIALAKAGNVTVRECRFGADAPRDVIRDRAAKTALNLLRLELLA